MPELSASALVGSLLVFSELSYLKYPDSLILRKLTHMVVSLERRLAAETLQRDELERRMRMIAGSNADDYRWFQNAAKQAMRALDARRK